MSGSGWQLSGDAPTAYTKYIYPLMEPWTDDLIRAAQCRPGDRVLDVACGPGLVASRVNAVASAECRLTGIDVNEAMLNLARRIPGIDWHLGSVAQMPFADASFDVVLCQQGLQYFPDRPAAMREMARVLAPGGRISLNVWGPMHRNPFQNAMAEVLGEVFGAEPVAPFRLAFSLNTAEELRRLAADAGLHGIAIRFAHRTARQPDLALWINGFMQASPLAARFMAEPEARRAEIVSRIAARLESCIDDSGAAVAQENHFLFATRP
jgi:ubiquinone/menaquinone biosynthesis C-methylase UbiE